VTKNLNLGFTGSLVGNASTKMVEFPLVNVDDFKPSSVAPNQVVISDVLTASIDQPRTVRYQVTPRNDVFAGQGIDVSAIPSTRKGVDIYIETREVWEVTDSSDPTFRKLLPIRGGMSFTFPSDPAATDGQVEDFALRVMSAIFDPTADQLGSGSRIPDLRRGVVNPKA
jgi:hypothetical protein